MRFHNLAVCGIALLLVAAGKSEGAPHTLYGLVETPNFNELLTYDLTQNPFSVGGYQPSTLAPLDFTNLLPQNSITSIAVSGNTLYGLVTTPNFNELLTYDLTQNPFSVGGYQPSTLAPLDFTNLLPQNSIIDIAVDSASDNSGGSGSTGIPEPGSFVSWILCVLTLVTVHSSHRRNARVRQ